jgi:HD-GYP domain-containing protein (c-di-GMP phosphodiesterase class II)
MKTESRIHLVVTLIALAAFISIPLLTGGNYSVGLLPTLVFVSLILIAVFRNVVITSSDVEVGSAATPAIIVGAAVVAFSLGKPFGLFIAALSTAIYPPNIKTREWSKLIFNVSNEVLGSCSAYLTFKILALSLHDELVIYLLKVGCGALAYLISTYLLLGVVFVAAGINWQEALYDTRKSFEEVLPLAIFSGLLGRFYFVYGTLMLFVFVVPLFLGRELASSYANMTSTQRATLDTLIFTLEQKDKYTAGHVERVAKFAKYIGEELGYGPKRLERVRQAALLHDAGKLIVPSALLNKPGKLTDEEFKIIQRHEFVTIKILSSIDFLRSIAVTAGGDHNKMENMNTRKLEPYIVSCCDAFDAMTSSRSYRKALPMEVAFEELRAKTGKQFHPKVVDALIKAIESRGEHYGAGYETDIVHEDAPEAGIGSAGIGDLEEDKESANAQAAQSAPTSAVSQPITPTPITTNGTAAQTNSTPPHA